MAKFTHLIPDASIPVGVRRFGRVQTLCSSYVAADSLAFVQDNAESREYIAGKSWLAPLCPKCAVVSLISSTIEA